MGMGAGHDELLRSSARDRAERYLHRARGRAGASEMGCEPTDFAAVDRGAGHQREDQLSQHAKNRTKLTEGNLRLLAAGSPPSAPPPRPAALALRLFSMAPDCDDVGRVLSGVRMASLEVQWVMGPEPAGT